MGDNDFRYHRPHGRGHDIYDLHGLRDELAMPATSNASSEYDFGEDSITDAILAYEEPSDKPPSADQDFSMEDGSTGAPGMDNFFGRLRTPERPQNVELGVANEYGHLPTPPPSTQGGTPRGAFAFPLDTLQTSPLAVASSSRTEIRPGFYPAPEGNLKRKVTAGDNLESLEGPQRKRRMSPSFANNPGPVVKSPSGLWTSLITKLPYAIQYALARLASNRNFDYGNLEFSKISQLKNLNLTNETAIPQLAELLKTDIQHADATQEVDQRDMYGFLFERENKARDPWKELDLEERAASPYGCMGYKDDGSPSAWYGGKVQLRGTSIIDENTGEFHLRLERPTLGPSTQVTRRLGSKCLFRLKFSDNYKEGRLAQKFLVQCKRPLVLCGSVYRAFYVKEETVFFIRTNEVWDSGKIASAEEVQGQGMSFIEFLQWYNPIELNGNQAMAKWVSRLALMLSNSVPGFQLRKENIKFIDDIVSETGSNMTDGAGTMNRALKRRLAHHHQSKQEACAVQVRVYGAKGLLTEDVYDLSQEPMLYLTPSQRKIEIPEHDNDPSRVAVDLVRFSHLRVGNQISAELLTNLSDNGVPLPAFISLLKTRFEEQVKPFLKWCTAMSQEGTCAPQLLYLWKFIQTDRGVLTSRLGRENSGTARVRGYRQRDVQDGEVDDGEDIGDSFDSNQRASRWWPDPVSGQPASIPETVLGLLDAGFTPDSCPALRERLRMMVMDSVKREKEAIRVDVPLSAIAFIEPDRSGVLKEDEISVRSTKCVFQRRDGTMANVLVGDVLLARYPCKLPTDIRKLRAVDVPQLDSKKDTIVLSTQGPRRVADWLGGGDYDGDKAIVIWQPDLVDPFTNAPEEYADPPEDMSQYFDKDTRKASEVWEEIQGLPPDEQISRMQDYCLAPLLTRTEVGAYSSCHERAVYKLGYRHHTTRRLAHMFCMVMDASKSGVSVKRHVYDQDMRTFNLAPAWKGTTGQFDQTNMGPLQRDPGLGPFIMDELLKEAKIQGDIHLARLEKAYKEFQFDTEDTALSAPFREIVAKLKCPRAGALYREDLERIHEHVQKEHALWFKAMHSVAPRARPLTSPKKKRKGKAQESESTFTNRDIEDRQDILRAASQRFASAPKPETMFMPAETVASVKASYAYVYDSYHKDFSNKEFSLDDMIRKVEKAGEKSRVSWSRFPWDVAYTALGELKAKSLGDYKPIARTFYDRMNLKLPIL